MQQTLEDAFQSAMVAFHEGDWLQAESLLQSLTTQWPDCIEARYQLGELYQLQQRWDKALLCYEQVLAQNDQIQEVWLSLGRIAIQQHQPQLAQKYWFQALGVNPDYGEAHFHLGLLRVQEGEMAQAVGHLIQALKQNPALSGDFLVWVQTYAQQGQTLESLALADALLIQDSPEGEPALLLKVALLQDLGADSTALSLAEMSDRLAQWLPIYVSAQAGPTADQQADWSARLASLALSAWPETSWPYLPRLRSWYLHGLPAPVAPVTEKPVTEKPVLVTPPAPAPVRHLIWLLDQRSICWQDWALQHFRALPGQWQITLVCRFAALQAELSPHFQVPVYTLPPEPEAARQFLATLQADLILWSDPELDPLQHWLSRSELADLNLSWSGRSLGFDAGHSSIAGHLPQWPLYPLPGAKAVGAVPAAMPLSERPLLICPIPAMGLLPAELDQLQSLSENYQLLFFANAPERVLLQRYAQLWADLPSPAPLTKVWRQSQELSTWFQQARAMYLPQQAAELYALLARHYGLACCGRNPVTLPWGQSVSADQLDTLDTLGVASENWLHALPATRWAVELQSALHQRRNP